MKIKVDEFEYCTELIAKASIKPNGCMVHNGPVDEKGYCSIKVNGKKWYVHRFVALYHIARSEEQIMSLMKFKIRQTCGLTVCINPIHLEFATSPAEKKWEKLVDWWNEPAEYRY